MHLTRQQAKLSLKVKVVNLTLLPYFSHYYTPIMELHRWNSSEKKLPWWTWVVPLPIFFIGTLLSLEAKISTGSSLFPHSLCPSVDILVGTTCTSCFLCKRYLVCRSLGITTSGSVASLWERRSDIRFSFLVFVCPCC